jgi:hypothetical protein
MIEERFGIPVNFDQVNFDQVNFDAKGSYATATMFY